MFTRLLAELAQIPDPHLRLKLIDELASVQREVKGEIEATSRYGTELERQARELMLLGTARNALARQLDLQEVIRAVVESIADTFGYALVSIYLLQGGELVLQYQVGYETVIERIPVSKGVSGKVIRTGQPVLLSDVRSEPEFLGAIPGIISEICVPLIDENQVVGMLNVESVGGRDLNEEDLSLMIALSEHVGIAMQRARLYSQLREGHERYQAVVNSVADVIYQTSLDGHLTFLNSAWARITGFDVSESLGKHISTFYYQEDLDYALSQRQLLLDRKEPVISYQARLLTKDGGIKWVEINAQPFFNDLGVLIGTSGTLTDISVRKIAEESEHEQRLFSDTMREVAAVLTSTLELGEMLDKIANCVARVVLYTALSVSMLENRQLVPVRGYGYAERGISNWMLAFDMPARALPHYELLILLGKPVIIDNPGQDLLRNACLPWVKTRMYVPIRAYGEVIGVICLDHEHENAFFERDADRALAIADQAGMAIRNAELYAALRVRAQDLQNRVTERTAELKLAHLRLEAVLNASSDGIAVVNMDGEIIQCNPAFRDLFDIVPTDIPGYLLLNLIQESSQETIKRALVAAFTESERRRVEMTAVGAHNILFEADVLLDPMPEHDLVVCSLRDMTQRLQVEKELRKALDEERKLVELKSQFGVTVSHEFRTPLSAIQSSVEFIERYYPQISETRRKESFDNIRNQIDYMTQVIDNILLVSKADTIGLHINWQMIDLLKTCSVIVQEMQWLAGERHQIVFTHDGELSQARMDPYLVRRILVNLLSNAIKYSPSNTQIEFRLVSDGQNVTMIVRDDGIGIPPDDIERLFDTFQRATNVGSIPGTGIGLAIVKRAVDLHKGSISVASTQGQGTTFEIRLPLFGG